MFKTLAEVRDELSARLTEEFWNSPEERHGLFPIAEEAFNAGAEEMKKRAQVLVKQLEEILGHDCPECGNAPEVKMALEQYKQSVGE